MPSETTLGLEKNTVRLVTYDPEWPEQYKQEKERIETLLKGKSDEHIAVHIEHVGSTAVPLIVAKPILDILIGCKDRRETSLVEAKLIEDGAELVGPLAGRGMNLLVKGDPREFHYHVTRYRGEHWYRVLRIRDHLLRHPGVARQYETLKKELAFTHAQDRLGYTQAKIPFLRAIDRRAEIEIHCRTLQELFRRTRVQSWRAWEETELWVKPGQVKIASTKAEQLET